MKASGVIEAVDVGEDRPVRVLMIEPAMTEQVLKLEGAPERLHRGVVVAIAPATHRGVQVVLRQQLPEGGAGVLGAAIGVHDQAADVGWRVCRACCKARSTNSDASVVAVAQPTMRRLNRSMTPARYNQPSTVST